MNLQFLFARNGAVISEEQALSIAQEECLRRKWDWSEPVRVKSGWRNWVVETSVGCKGLNATIVIDKQTGKVKRGHFTPR